MAHLSLSLLGPFQAELDGRPATGFESNKVRALLAYLAVEADRPHSRLALAGLLWPDYPDRSALNNLRSALANLRQTIGDQQAQPPFLTISRDTIQLNTSSYLSLDLVSLENLPGLPVDQLETAVAAYRGPFLEGFSLGDSPPFEEWLLFKREQTNRLVQAAYQRLASHYEGRENYDATIVYARRRLAIEPWDEDAHRQLMRAYACNGQRSSALAQYKACQKLLREELGVEPSPETTALNEQIRSGKLFTEQEILPGGTITILFTDIEGSTRLLEQLGEQYAALLDGQRKLLRTAFHQWHGREIDIQGDSFFVAFGKATDAIKCAIDVQQVLVRHIWPRGVNVKVRMGLHTGEPWSEGEGYVGIEVHRAARIAQVGHGGQVLLSETTSALVQDDLPSGAGLFDLGRHLLKDIHRPERISQLIIEGLPCEFPPLKSLETLPAEGARLPRKVGGCPYRGLSAFQEVDAPFYFGREGFVDLLAQAVREKKLVGVIVGASGSGKSSALLAGLLPRLRKEGGCQFAILRPAHQPFYALAGALLPLLEPGMNKVDLLAETRKLAERFTEGKIRLAQVVERIREDSPGTRQVLLVVDQFEELYTLCPDTALQTAFIDELLAAIEATRPHRDRRTIIVLTLRADFMGQALAHRPFADALQDASLLMGPMNRSELHLAIQKPAEMQGAAFEPGLVERILDDVGEKPGNLPLLEFTLTQLWERQTDGWLTHADYEAIGCVEGALADYADQVFAGLNKEEQELARRALVQLVQPGEGTEDTRRLATRSELGEASWQLVQHLADRRLVVTATDTQGRETAEVVHEALIRKWGRFQEWMEADRSFRTWQERLRSSLRQWQASQQDEGALLRGAPLAEAEAWLQGHKDELSGGEVEYIQAGVRLREHEAAERETQRQRELEAAQKLAEAERQRAEDQSRSTQRLQRRAWQLAGVLAVALILAGAATVFGRQASFNSRLANQNLVAAQSAEQHALGQQATAESERSRAEAETGRAETEALQRTTAEAQAVLERETAQQQARLAFSRELAAAAVSNLQVDPERSLLLAMQALENADTLEARNSLRRALPELHILRTIPAHRQTPGVAYSPDGTLLASIGTESPVKIWNAANGEQKLSLPYDPAGYGMAVAFSPDGTQVAALTTRQVIVWALPGGQPVLKLTADLAGATIIHASFSPDGKRLAVSNMDGVPQVLDLVSGTQVFALPGHTKICDAIAFSPDGARLATGDQTGMVKVWDAATGQELLSFGKGGVVHDLAYSPDGKRLATANEDGTLMVWDPTTGRELLSLPRMSGMYAVTFLPDSRRLVTAHQDGTAKMWDAISGQLLLTLAGHVSTVIGVASSPDGATIATGGYDGMLKIWDAAPGREMMTIAAHADQAYDISYSPDGSRLATAGLDGFARLWDPLAGELLLELDLGSPLTSLAYSPDGKLLATGAQDGTIPVWDSATGQNLMRLAGHQAWVMGVAFSPDGKRLVSGSWDATEKVWDLTTANEMITYTGHTACFGMGLVFSRDGKTVFSSGCEGYGHQWEVVTGRKIQEFSSNGLEVYGVAISPDGRLLALGLQDGAVEVWDTLQAEKVLTLSGHAGLVSRLAFSPDGKRLASAAFDGFAKVWDVQTGQELYTLYGNTSNVFGVAFSPDGTRLATAGGDGTVRVFTLLMDELLDLARSRLTRTLNDAECRQFLHVERCPAE